MIYMDNAATTRMSEKAFEAMRPYLMEQYANPAGTYSFASGAAAAVEKARGQVARVIGAKANEIYFTSGGTESDNWALKGVAQAYAAKGRHIIISAIEHHAVLHSADALKKQGWDATVLPVDENGVVAPQSVADAIREDTVLVSVMAANNEIGTIEPLAAIGEVCRSRGVLFHTDAVQAYAHVPLNVEEMHIDLLSASAQVPRSQGRGLPVCAQGREDAAVHGWRRAGKAPPRGHDERCRHRGDGRRRRRGAREHGRFDGEGFCDP